MCFIALDPQHCNNTSCRSHKNANCYWLVWMTLNVTVFFRHCSQLPFPTNIPSVFCFFYNNYAGLRMKVTFEDKVTPGCYLFKHETMRHPSIHTSSSTKFTVCVEILPCKAFNDGTTCQTVLHLWDLEMFLKHTCMTVFEVTGRLALSVRFLAWEESPCKTTGWTRWGQIA